MMTMPEGPVKLATSVVDAMKSSPMMLALIVLNVIFVGMIYFAIKENRNEIHETQKAMLAQLADEDARIHALLQSCLQMQNR